MYILPHARRLGAIASSALLLALLLGCTPREKAPPELVAQTQQGSFVNGNFESGTPNLAPANWTVTPYLVAAAGITYPPQSVADLNLSAGTVRRTFTLSAAAAEAAIDPDLGTTASLRWPKYGTQAAIVNQRVTGRVANSLKQTMTIGVGDIDPQDGKAHVRFTVAPVLENPSHPPHQQPFYFVEVRNITKGTVLYHDFNASAQPGVPWKQVGSYFYTDWQLVDVGPGNAAMALDDVIELEVIASGCAQSGHWGHVYVDGVAAQVPGLFVGATGPNAQNAGSNITYTLSYGNGGTGSASNVQIDFNTPPNTTWVGVNAPGLTCTEPAVGDTGLTRCTVGNMAPGSGGSLDVTVAINPAATGTITNGNYSIFANDVALLLGGNVDTTITTGLTYSDLSVTVSNGVAALAWGQSVTYTIGITNHGPSVVNGATVTDTMPGELTDVSWICTGFNGGVCLTGSGNGNIGHALDLPVGASATFIVSAQVIAGSGTDSVTHTASVTLPGGINDTNSGDNLELDTDPIGDLRTITLTKGGPGLGRVVSSPAAIQCKANCVTVDEAFADGDTVALNAIAGAGEAFSGWGGDCSGAGTLLQCTLTMTRSMNVTATFTVPSANGDVCADPVACASGNCVDGVCCNSACGAGASDCQACNLSGTEGTCSPVAAGPICRAAAGLCDVAEACDGVSLFCPANALAVAGVECRASGGSCDPAENCTGAVVTCPTDILRASSFNCRGASCAAGVGTLAANCTGASVSCPAVATASCGEYVCAATACGTNCGSNLDCVSTSYCSNGSCLPREADGQSCTSSVSCASGFCVDGVCCDSLCSGQCQACDAVGLSGVCSPVSDAPHGSRPACASDGSVCAGSCDGVNTTTCGYPGAAIECRAGSCAGGVGTSVAVCDEAGACPASGTAACAPYACGVSACLSSCSSNSDCVAGNYCGSSGCAPKLTPGLACVAAGDCVSGNCVDGVCCDTSCSGQCEACDVTGSVGACSAVTNAPHGSRTPCAGDGSVCQGSCDGVERLACAYPASVTECRPGSCANDLATVAAGCNGAGACPLLQTQPCGAFICGASACLGNCTVDTDCTIGNYCAGGVCVLTLTLGTACAESGNCASGNCVDGVCCDGVCIGQCEACDVAGSVGTCSAVTDAPHGSRTPCESDGSVCQGLCDGLDGQGCTYPDLLTECRVGSCINGEATVAAACNGLGTCPALQTQPCGEFICGASACLGNCTVDAECASGNYCAGGVCVATLPPGTACAASGDCASGHCVDGVCCDSACTGQCQACDVPNALGTCSAVNGAPHAPRLACQSDGSLCGGTCDGVNTTTCGYPSAASQCRADSCANEVATIAAVCDGAGACPASEMAACAPYGCGVSTCLTSCSSNGDCVTGNYCSSNGCTPRLFPGLACVAAGDCLSGNCVDGVCCDTTCSGQCEACDVTGSVGVCSAVSNAPHGSRTPCASDGSVCQGSCDGVERLACAYPASAIACRAGSCASDVATVAAGCNGAGACPPLQTQPCGEFICGASACLGNCAVDTDCTTGNYCAGGVCVPTVALGTACTAAGHCASGNCVDGVCCDGVCGGQCEACDLAGALGACSAVTDAPHGNRTPCASDGSVCQGSCDGVERLACTYPASAIACRAGSCASDVATVAAGCNGAGACPLLQTQPCGEFICGASACLGDCTADTDCSTGNYCAGGVCVSTLALGTACAAGGDCESGNCVDGVCCDRTCSGQCEACDLLGALGTCSTVAGPPRLPRLPCASDGSLCGGVCDGATAEACVYPDEITECRGGSCTDNLATVSAGCDAAGACPTLRTEPCGGFTCGASACLGNCTLDADCSEGNNCSAGICVANLDLGDECVTDGDCRTARCVDGVCCDGACTGQCEACDLPDALGVCSPVDGSPHPPRLACRSDAVGCGGSCDGVTRAVCSYPSEGVTCRSGSCSNDVATLPADCDGAGACPALQTQPCGEFICGAAGCLGNCTVDTECTTGNYCAGGVCVATEPEGTLCSRDNECLSASCVDGVCCDAVCNGQCEACDVVGALGRCTAASGSPHGARPPCPSDGSICAGACDGVTRTGCGFPDAETQCRAGSCTSGVATVAAGCDAAGACPSTQTQDCGGFACGPITCLGDCRVDSDCLTGRYCSAGVCATTLVAGSECVTSNQCAFGPCVDGVCCDTTCTGQCEACDVVGSVGTCSPASGPPHRGRTACAADGPLCGGSCDGERRDACTYPEVQVECRAPSCTNGLATLAAGCNGAGACSEVQIQGCGSFVCGLTACLGNCSVDTDCDTGGYCSAGVCVPLLLPGSQCGSNEQCAIGICVDGVCCDSLCDRPCEACDLTGSLGSCLPVIGSPHAGRAPCGGVGLCRGSCDGQEVSACAFPMGDTVCSQASCSEGIARSAAFCDGNGSCDVAETTSCGDYACDRIDCGRSCEKNDDCQAPSVCVFGACLADDGSGGSGGEAGNFGMGATAPTPDPPPQGPSFEGGGVSCRTAGGNHSSSLLSLIAALGAVSVLRRRRSARHAA